MTLSMNRPLQPSAPQATSMKVRSQEQTTPSLSSIQKTRKASHRSPSYRDEAVLI